MRPVKASSKEEEYFLRLEAQKIKAKAERVKRETEEAQRIEMKQRHRMRCPKCGMELREIQYCGIQIDKCFSGGGIYLDDGELEQIAWSEGDQGVLAGLSRIFSGRS
jgi:hypothetical protein